MAPALYGPLLYDLASVAANDLTGITGPEENEKGLEDARRALSDLGRIAG
jgi:hypothetical protein